METFQPQSGGLDDLVLLFAINSPLATIVYLLPFLSYFTTSFRSSVMHVRPWYNDNYRFRRYQAEKMKWEWCVEQEVME